MLKIKQVTWFSPEQSRSWNRSFIFSTWCAHAHRYVVVACFFPHKGLHSINATFVEKYRLRCLLWVPLKARNDKWSRLRERTTLCIKSFKCKNMNISVSCSPVPLLMCCKSFDRNDWLFGYNLLSFPVFFFNAIFNNIVLPQLTEFVAWQVKRVISAFRNLQNDLYFTIILK